MKTKVSKTLIAVLVLLAAAAFINFSAPQKVYAIDALVPPCDDIEGYGREVLVGGIPNSGVVNFEPAYEPLPEHTACVRDKAASDSRYDLEGWVWDTNLGWISLYCPAGAGQTNQGIPCSGTYEGGYGVYVDATNGELRGYAWGDNTGWISFSCKDDAGGCSATNTHQVIVEFDIDCQGDIYSIPNVLPGLCPDHTIDNSYAWSDSVGWIDLHGVHIPIDIPAMIDVVIDIIPDPAFSGKDDPLVPTSNGTDEYFVTVEMTDIDTGLPVPQTDHTFYIVPSWIDTVRYDQITRDIAEDHSTDNNGPVDKPFSITDFAWDSDAELFTAPVKSAAPTSDMNYYTVGFSNEKFMLPNDMADININPNELFLVNAEIAIYDSLNQQCIYPYSYATGIDEATCFANPTLDNPPGYVAPNGRELYFAPSVDLSVFDNLSADDPGTIIGRYTVADQISMEKKCTLADCAIANIALYQEIEEGGFIFDPTVQNYTPDDTFPAEHLYTPLCGIIVDDEPQCPLTGEDASMYSVVTYNLGSGLTEYFSAKLPRVFGTVVVNPVAEIFGNVYSTGVTNPQTGQTVRSLGDVSTNILRDTIVKNVAAIVAGAVVNDDESTANVTSDGTNFQIQVNDGVALMPDEVGEPRVFYFRNKQVILENPSEDTLAWTGNRTIIVEGGNVFINSNLYNEPPSTAKLGIIVLKDYASEDKGEQGHVYIHPDVTDMQANIYADGSVFSYDGNDSNILSDSGEPMFLSESARSSVLLDQLFITGSIASKNTIGGAVKTPNPILGDGRIADAVEGSYGITPSGRSQARLYDLNFLRYYGFVFERGPSGNAIDQQLKLIDPATADNPSTPGYNIVAEPAPGKGYPNENPDGDLIINEGGNPSLQATDQFSAVYVKFDPPPADLPGFGVTVGADVTIRGQ
jgi:hypothetical protein